ncbi:MAG: hypothetical protein LAT67_04465 [Balneolales bacterium]|nr:hypothetical protein [Balneolales bacterium]
MTIFSKTTAAFFAILAFLLIAVSACEDTRRGPDFSLVPDPISLTGLTPDTTLPNGVVIYIIQEGDPGFGPLTIRDRALMRYSIWRENGRGRVLDSSYQGRFADPVIVDILNLEIGAGINIITGGYFRGMVNGMLPAPLSAPENTVGEIRAALVPPSLTQFSDTLRYDVELFSILD